MRRERVPRRQSSHVRSSPGRHSAWCPPEQDGGKIEGVHAGAAAYMGNVCCFKGQHTQTRAPPRAPIQRNPRSHFFVIRVIIRVRILSNVMLAQDPLPLLTSSLTVFIPFVVSKRTIQIVYALAIYFSFLLLKPQKHADLVFRKYATPIPDHPKTSI